MRPLWRRRGPGRGGGGSAPDGRRATGRRGPRQRLAARVPDLLADRSFRRYWSGQTISMFGDQISSIALPLVGVLGLHASPAQMGFLVALEWVPSLLFGLHAGAWVDRRGHRRATMIGTDLGRFALLASIPVGYAFGVLTLWQLYGVAFGVGVLSVLFTVSDPTLFVSLVPEDRYVEGNSLIYGSRALSFVGGPSVGGALVQFLTAPLAVLADAVSFLGSAFFLTRIRPVEPPAAEPGKGLGAMLTKRLAAWLGVGRVYTISCLVFTAPLALVPLAAGPRPVILAMLMTAEFIAGFGVMTLDISIGSIFSAVIPNDLRSRVSGAFQAVNYGTRPLGALTGGLLGTLIGPRATLWVAAAGGTLGFLLLLPTSLPSFRMPETSRPQHQPATAADRGGQDLAEHPA